MADHFEGRKAMFMHCGERELAVWCYSRCIENQHCSAMFLCNVTYNTFGEDQPLSSVTPKPYHSNAPTARRM